MFLKRIELKGFKSFLHPTSIVLDDKLIVIVGPNGSGKSNINDAIKWVLGEGSKKVLRTDNSNDVIFSGSKGKSKSDMAEVNLIFNNTRKILDISFDEVSVKRRIYRNKDLSEYYINNSLVRKKDVTNLFLDTGLGNSDLSIISQQSITQIALAKPEQLRDVLNEAAGVGKYQKKKLESKRKLEKIIQDLEIFEVKMNELNKQIFPLRAKKEKAEKYLKIKRKLSEIELPLIKKILTNDIPDLEKISKDLESLTKKKEFLDITIRENAFKTIELQNTAMGIDNDLEEIQDKQINLLNSKNEMSLQDSKENLDDKINSLNDKLLNLSKINNDNEKKLKLIESEKRELISKISYLNFRRNELLDLNNKLVYDMKNNSIQKINRGTSFVIQNRKIFSEIDGLISEVLKVDKDYQLAFEISLGRQLNNIVVKDKKTIIEAVNFLKKNKYGIATFVPIKDLNVQKIPFDYISLLEKEKGYQGVLSSFVKCDKKFESLSMFYAGKTLIFDNIKNSLRASTLINNRYKIVTLEGDVIFPGSIIRGGYNFSRENNFEEIKKVEKSKIKSSLGVVELDLKKLNNNLNNTEKQLFFYSKEISVINERKNNLETILNNDLDFYAKKYNKKFVFQNKSNKIEHLSFEKLRFKIKELQNRKRDISKELIILKTDDERNREKWQKSVESISSSSKKIDTLEKQISFNMTVLNKDYKLTYDLLMLKKDLISLKMSEKDALDLRTKLRDEIFNLGHIDIEAIEEYERLSKDYELIKFNSSDLRTSKNKLEEIISKLDIEMRIKFESTFEKVNIKFNETFSKLFRGGSAKLIYSDDENFLESGIIVEANAPGKKIKSLKLFSGGEKSLMAIAMIFAINLTRDLPILILDEPEAALDESNVDRFAKFSKELNKTSQVIITSHRPGTMEVADVLYGVAMQDQGISKIVSVKLAEAKKIIK